jgi:protein TonB
MDKHADFKKTGVSGNRGDSGRISEGRPIRERSADGRDSRRREAGVVSKAAVVPLTWPVRGPHKAPHADLRHTYSLRIEVGFVLSLLALIALFNTQIQQSQNFDTTAVQQEVVQMEEIVQTEQIQKPPPPPRPQLPIVVADDVILDDVDLNLDAALDIGEPLETQPPPPPPVEEEVVEEVEDEIFVVVEQMPELIGGIEALQSQIRYPELARQAGVSGRVFVLFVVNEQGDVTDPVVLRGVGGGCDEEAMRVVKLAKFKPGMQRGKAVKVRYVIPIVFKLR